MFKSEDGVFTLKVRVKEETEGELVKIMIHDKRLKIKIKPGLTQFSALDSDTLALRFQLDQEYLVSGR